MSLAEEKKQVIHIYRCYKTTCFFFFFFKNHTENPNEMKFLVHINMGGIKKSIL